MPSGRFAANGAWLAVQVMAHNLARWTARIGLGEQRNVHAHLFRHGCERYAINFLNCGGRLDALQEQLGHRDINTTRIYLRLTSEDVMCEVAKVQF